MHLPITHLEYQVITEGGGIFTALQNVQPHSFLVHTLIRKLELTILVASFISPAFFH